MRRYNKLKKSFRNLTEAYKLWIPMAVDSAWASALKEQIDYFRKNPSLSSAENSLEFLNQIPY